MQEWSPELTVPQGEEARAGGGVLVVEGHLPPPQGEGGEVEGEASAGPQGVQGGGGGSQLLHPLRQGGAGGGGEEEQVRPAPRHRPGGGEEEWRRGGRRGEGGHLRRAP